MKMDPLLKCHSLLDLPSRAGSVTYGMHDKQPTSYVTLWQISVFGMVLLLWCVPLEEEGIESPVHFAFTSVLRCRFFDGLRLKERGNGTCFSLPEAVLRQM
jgi:hypothetical protein